MAVAEDKADNQLREITECSICMSAFIDPRMLPCIHTFCFQCLQRTAEQKKPGDEIPCPLCRKEFTIPPEGIIGLQRNFFMENLLEYKITLLQSNHATLEIGTETKEEGKPRIIVKSCSKHTQKPLDYYCANCKQIVCVSCFVESHKFHDCKDVTTVDEKFRQMIEKYSQRISSHGDEMLSLKKNAKMRKADLLNKIVENETAIIKRSREIKDILDQHTKSLLDELSVIKSSYQKEMEMELEEIDLRCTILSNFEAYCTELRTKGSAIDICSVVDKLTLRAAELHRDHREYIVRPLQSIEISFRPTFLTDCLLKSNNNFVGQIKEDTTHFENSADVECDTDVPETLMGIWKRVGLKDQACPSFKNVIIPTKQEKDQKCIKLKYNCAADLYVRGKGKIDKWSSLVFEAEHMMRKVEYDWDMVYLARVENVDRSKITWKVDLGSCRMSVSSVDIEIHTKCYENGKIIWELCGDQQDLMVTLTSGMRQTVTTLRDSKVLLLTATLTKGVGVIAWQHTQLFRQKRFPERGLDLEWPFRVAIRLKE